MFWALIIFFENHIFPMFFSWISRRFKNNQRKHYDTQYVIGYVVKIPKSAGLTRKCCHLFWNKHQTNYIYSDRNWKTKSKTAILVRSIDWIQRHLFLLKYVKTIEKGFFCKMHLILCNDRRSIPLFQEGQEAKGVTILMAQT